MQIKKHVPARFILTGFAQEQGFRRFNFECIGADNTRADFSVRADLDLIRSYGIHVQDLPLLCLELLERSAGAEIAHRLTFTEEDMRLHQADRLAAQRATDQKKRHPRKAAPSNIGNAWRTSLSLGTHT